MAACDAKPLRLRGSQSGQVIVMFAVCLVILLGIAALVVDVGYAYYVKRQLQASADAAALAGAQSLPDPATASATAMLVLDRTGSRPALVGGLTQAHRARRQDLKL